MVDLLSVLTALAPFSTAMVAFLVWLNGRSAEKRGGATTVRLDEIHKLVNSQLTDAVNRLRDAESEIAALRHELGEFIKRDQPQA